MARDDDEDTPWTRQLLVGVGVLVAVSLVIGGVVSLVALGAARVTGINDARPTATQAPSVYIPGENPTTTPEPFPDPAGSDATVSPSPSATPSTPKPKKRTRSISLQAYPKKVSPHERVNLTGVYDGAEGARLQVQRFENGWVDFPVSTSVSGGLFDTYVFSGREGLNRFRVIDPDSGRRSNPVRVTIG
jgi:hypothetical protein